MSASRLSSRRLARGLNPVVTVALLAALAAVLLFLALGYLTSMFYKPRFTYTIDESGMVGTVSVYTEARLNVCGARMVVPGYGVVKNGTGWVVYVKPKIVGPGTTKLAYTLVEAPIETLRGTVYYPPPASITIVLCDAVGRRYEIHVPVGGGGG